VLTISIVPVVAITVNVDDAATTAPIVNAKVSMAGQIQYTDAGGTTIFENLAGNKTYTLQISKEGYVAKSATVAVGTADETVDVSLTPGVAPPPACAIATAAYGSPLAPELDVFRAYRDQVLLENPLGRLFVKAYYKTSPPFAAVLARSEILKALARKFLGKILERIQ